MEQFAVKEGDWVLDPFCGSGTTLVECLKKGINAVGVDANPASCFAASVKSDWTLNVDRLRGNAAKARAGYLQEVRSKRYLDDPTYRYLDSTGFIERGWMSQKPLRKALALKRSIQSLRITPRYKNALMLALITEITTAASNIKFGPELYCGPAKENHNVLDGFLARVETIASDLGRVAGLARSTVSVVQGDSRACGAIRQVTKHAPYAAVISSPPYPAEHDYTRNSRLELAFLDEVSDIESLRAIKKAMIRSHSKGIYVTDSDGDAVAGNNRVMAVVKEIQGKVEHKDYGFARYYPVVAKEYFGGIKKHLSTIPPLLREDGVCAYVVGDQSSYLGVHIPTAEIISEISNQVGFKTATIEHWRNRWSTTKSKNMEENILIMRKT
ncbi:MAG TPA: DNA methyltransferase [Bryobacteraceae bacterium]|nr:DNA methyltransferase [Bryobacteraceae bacterium]